jgi:hypothetical protein
MYLCTYVLYVDMYQNRLAWNPEHYTVKCIEWLLQHFCYVNKLHLIVLNHVFINDLLVR